VRSYREKGKVKQQVVHLGEHSTAESALEAWPQEIKRLKRIGRPKKAKTLQRKLDKLQELNEGGMRCFRFTDLVASKKQKNEPRG
jgi:hypothetical protein